MLPVAALGAMIVLPLAEIAARPFQTGIPGASLLVQHLTLWVAFLGAAVAAREGKLLALATGTFLPHRLRLPAAIFAAAVGAAVAGLLAVASWELVALEREGGATVAAGIPAWVGQLVLPVAFAAIALRLAWHGPGAWRAPAPWWGRAVALAAAAAGAWLGSDPAILAGRPVWPGIVVILAATALGSPLFAVLGGLAALLFLHDGIPAATVALDAYQLSVSPFLASIPLFTAAGFLLAEGRAAERLVGVFRGWFGWLPGGTAVVCAAVCAFFTVFTGGSGVTILALGALLLTALQADGYRDRFSLGLLTSSGSLGLLLPPALPLILYGIVAEISIPDLLVGGILPGLLLVAMVAAWGVREGLVSGVERRPFVLRAALAASWRAKWELLLPLVVLAVLFSGLATLVETAAFAALYALVSQLAHRDIGGPRQLFRVLRDCAVLLGGVLIILAVAKGFTSWLVDAQVPFHLVEWAQRWIHSPLVFLLALNLFLLLVGCLMDIFSAIVVVVPLIAPLGEVFGIHPVHLGIIFIANLELGYLTPPVGLNLFLASYRFGRPLLEVYDAAVPWLVQRAIAVLLITYVPWLSTALLGWLGP
jgi:tripartite ATP-independent transporter DctM subunit